MHGLLKQPGYRLYPPDGPEARALLLWVKIHELLGRVPQGSTARFLKDGMLPGDAQGGVAAVVPTLARFSRRCSRELVERAGAGHTRRVGGDQAWTQYAAGPTSSIAR
jgi:hypothetical protein